MANGNFAGGDGTKNNPYLIEDAFDLDAIRNDYNAHYKLVSDINLNVAPFNVGEGWKPIGGYSSSQRFRGGLDGNGYVVSGLYISRPNQDYQGLIGYTKDHTIKNIGLDNVYVTGRNRTGGLSGGFSLDGEVMGCFVRGVVKGNSDVGLIAGITHSPVKNSYGISGSPNSRMVGINYSDVINSYFVGGTLIGRNANAGKSRRSFWEDVNSSSSSSGTQLNSEEMMTPKIFIDAGWHNELNEQGEPVWILEEGQYPRLWFEKLPYKTFILSDNSAYAFDEDVGAWEDKGEIPTGEDKAQFFEDYGMDNISKDALKLIASQIPDGKGKIVGMEMD